MDFQTFCSETNRIPKAIAKLGSEIKTVSGENARREAFYTWYTGWYPETAALIDQAKQCLRELEDSALCDGCANLEERQAIKEAIDLEPLVESIGEQISIMASSVDQEMRFGHIWKMWNLNLGPSCKRLELALRKFCITCSGL